MMIHDSVQPKRPSTSAVYAQTGLTLIELMVALTLGLLISAAALQMLLSSQKTLSTQSATSEVRDAASFGVNRLLESVSMAGFNRVGSMPARDEPLTWANNITRGGGVVFTVGEPSTRQQQTFNIMGKGTITAAHLTLTAPNTSLSNVNVNSDQLTIQYMPTNAGFDCEGRAFTWVTDPAEADALAKANRVRMVVERYYVQRDSFGATSQDLALYCDAGFYDAEAAPQFVKKSASEPLFVADVKDMNANAQILIPNVDYFGVRFGIYPNNNGLNSPEIRTNTPPDRDVARISYITAANYTSAAPFLEVDDITRSYYTTPPRVAVVSLKIALVLRSQQRVNLSYLDSSTVNPFGTALTLRPEVNGGRYFRKTLVLTSDMPQLGGENIYEPAP